MSVCVCVGVWVCVLLSLCVGMREGQKQRKRRQKEETHEAGNAGPVDQRMTVTSARDCLLPDADGDAVGDVAIRVKRLHTRQLLGLLWRGDREEKDRWFVCQSAGAAGEIPSPESTFCADSYLGIRSTPVLPQ